LSTGIFFQMPPHDDELIMRIPQAPIFCIKFQVSETSPADIVAMFVDAARGLINMFDTSLKAVGLPGVLPQLQIPPIDFSFIDELLPFKFQLEFELSTTTDGIFEGPCQVLDAEGEVALFGFEFSFKFKFNLKPDLDAMFTEPTKILRETGLWVSADLVLPCLGVKNGEQVCLGEMSFSGIASPALFALNASAWFEFGPVAFDAYFEFEWRTLEREFQLSFGGSLELGPLGGMGLYGSITNTPSFAWELEGDVDVGLNGFCMKGRVAGSSTTGHFLADLEAQFGPFGSVLFLCEIGSELTYPNYPAGPANPSIPFMVMEGMVEVDVSAFLTYLTSWLISTLCGQEVPSEDNLVYKALQLIFDYAILPVEITYISIAYDSRKLFTDVRVDIRVFTWKWSLELPLPNPFSMGRRRTEESGHAEPEGWDSQVPFVPPNPFARRSLRESEQADKRWSRYVEGRDVPAPPFVPYAGVTPAHIYDPERTAENEQDRRRLGSGMEGCVMEDLSLDDIIDKIKEEITWGKVMNMIGEVNYTWDRSLGDSNAAIKASVSGYVNLLMNEQGGWLTLRGEATFIGLTVRGELVLSVFGGVLKAELEGSGTTQDIPYIDIVCPACPVLEGSFRATYDTLVTPTVHELHLAVYIQWFGMVFEGEALFTREGGLEMLYMRAHVDPGSFLLGFVDTVINMLTDGGLDLSDNPAVKVLRELLKTLHLPEFTVEYYAADGFTHALTFTITLYINTYKNGIEKEEVRHLVFEVKKGLTSFTDFFAEMREQLSLSALLKQLADLDFDLPALGIDFGIDKKSVYIPRSKNDVALRWDAWEVIYCEPLWRRRQLEEEDVRRKLRAMTDAERLGYFDGEPTFWHNGELYKGTPMRNKDGFVVEHLDIDPGEVDVYDVDAQGRTVGLPHRAHAPHHAQQHGTSNRTSRKLFLDGIPCYPYIKWHHWPIEFKCCEIVIIPQTRIDTGAQVSLLLRETTAALEIDAWLYLDVGQPYHFKVDEKFEASIELYNTERSSICDLVPGIKDYEIPMPMFDWGPFKLCVPGSWCVWDICCLEFNSLGDAFGLPSSIPVKPLIEPFCDVFSI